MSTRGPRSSSGPSGSLDARDHLPGEELERAVREVDGEARQARPEEEAVAARPLANRLDAGGDLVGPADDVALARQVVRARERRRARPLAVAVVLVENVL